MVAIRTRRIPALRQPSRLLLWGRRAPCACPSWDRLTVAEAMKRKGAFPERAGRGTVVNLLQGSGNDLLT